MKILKKEMSRREFLKYAFGSAILLGIGSLGVNLKEKPKKKDENSKRTYGSGMYGE